MAILSTALDIGGDVFGGFFGGGDTECNPSVVLGDPRVDKLTEWIRLHPADGDRLRRKFTELWGGHHCLDTARSMWGTAQGIAIVAIWAATGLSDRNVGTKDREYASLVEAILAEAERAQESVLGGGGLNWLGGDSGTASSTTSPSGIPNTAVLAGGAAVAVVILLLAFLAFK